MPQMCPMNWFNMSLNWNFFYLLLFIILYFYFQNFKKIENNYFKIKFFNYNMIW